MKTKKTVDLRRFEPLQKEVLQLRRQKNDLLDALQKMVDDYDPSSTTLFSVKKENLTNAKELIKQHAK